jgi:hypothetical protein
MSDELGRDPRRLVPNGLQIPIYAEWPFARALELVMLNTRLGDKQNALNSVGSNIEYLGDCIED